MQPFNPFESKPTAYLDWLSEEYNGMEYERRLLHMALFVYRGGDLQTFIDSYCRRNTLREELAIYETLMLNLAYLRTGDKQSGLMMLKILLSVKDKISIWQLIAMLQAELRANYCGTPTKWDLGTFRRRPTLAYDITRYNTPEQIAFGEYYDILTNTH